MRILAGASCSRSLVRVLDRDWQPGRSNFGGGSWMLYLECGHVEWRKASAGGLGLDIDAAVRAKMEKNKGRGHRHGGKRV